MAEFKRDMLRERVKTGMAHAKVKGVRLGRTATVQALNGQIRQMLADGMSKMAIAKELGIARKSVCRPSQILPDPNARLWGCRITVGAGLVRPCPIFHGECAHT